MERSSVWVPLLQISLLFCLSFFFVKKLQKVFCAPSARWSNHYKVLCSVQRLSPSIFQRSWNKAVCPFLSFKEKRQNCKWTAYGFDANAIQIKRFKGLKKKGVTASKSVVFWLFLRIKCKNEIIPFHASIWFCFKNVSCSYQFIRWLLRWNPQ